MRYGHVTDGIIDVTARSLPFSWENISGLNNMTDVELRQYGWLPWDFITVPARSDQVLDGSTIVIEQDRIVETQRVRDLTPEEIEAMNNQRKEENKAQAESLLTATDWTATLDVSDPKYSDPFLANQEAFLVYRGLLRQIAVNPPVDVGVWPTKPDEVWLPAQ